MPCACNIPQPAFPSKTIWGPVLWKILHSLAEYTGKIIIPLFQKEELFAWTYIITNLYQIIPCADCREHYKKWLKDHPITQLKNKTYIEQQYWIRYYFWSLHDSVNIRIGSDTVPFDVIPTLYKSVNIINSVKQYELIIQPTFQLTELSLTAWKNWLNHFRKLQNIYGL